MIRILIGALVCVLVTTPTLARNITKEVQYFRNVDVIYSENAHVCGFKDREPYLSFVKERLLQMDMPHYADAVTNVVVSITAGAGGLLKQRCIVFAQVRLEAPFKASFPDRVLAGRGALQRIPAGNDGKDARHAGRASRPAKAGPDRQIARFAAGCALMSA